MVWARLQMHSTGPPWLKIQTSIAIYLWVAPQPIYGKALFCVSPKSTKNNVVMLLILLNFNSFKHRQKGASMRTGERAILWVAAATIVRLYVFFFFPLTLLCVFRGRKMTTKTVPTAHTPRELCLNHARTLSYASPTPSEKDAKPGCLHSCGCTPPDLRGSKYKHPLPYICGWHLS